jgi:hypothetical protein
MSANLGKIAITIGGDHIISNGYERLTIVKSSTDVWYLSLWDVPANIPLTDQGYWVVFFDPAMNSQQVADNAQDIVGILQSIGTINTALEGKASTSHTHDYVPTSDVAILETASRIPKRDSSGDIHARLFRMSHDTRNENCNLFATLVDTTDNNYIRTSTVAQVKAKLGVRSYTQQKRGHLGDARTHYIYPPSGYTMSDLTSASIWVSELHMNSDTVNATCYMYYESTRITITTHTYVYGVGYYTAWEKV